MLPRIRGPPEQPKEFTPLVLLHHEHEQSMEHVTAITKALNTGAISDVISATSGDPLVIQPSLHHHDKLGEALKASKNNNRCITNISSSRNQ